MSTKKKNVLLGAVCAVALLGACNGTTKDLHSESSTSTTEGIETERSEANNRLDDPIEAFKERAYEFYDGRSLSFKENYEEYAELIPVETAGHTSFMVATLGKSGDSVELASATVPFSDLDHDTMDVEGLDPTQEVDPDPINNGKKIKAKCYGSSKPVAPTFDPKSAALIVVGIQIQDGSFIRKQLIEKNEDGTETQLYEAVRKAHEANKQEKVRKELSKASSADFTIHYIGEGYKSKTPYYNELSGHSFIHYVILDDNLRFRKKKQFDIYQSQTKKLYAPYYASHVYWPKKKKARKHAGRVATLQFYNKGMGIGEPPKEAIKPKEFCDYPYDFLLVSRKVIRDPSTGVAKYRHRTPIVVDPRNGSKGPP